MVSKSHVSHVPIIFLPCCHLVRCSPNLPVSNSLGFCSLTSTTCHVFSTLGLLHRPFFQLQALSPLCLLSNNLALVPALLKLLPRFFPDFGRPSALQHSFYCFLFSFVCFVPLWVKARTHGSHRLPNHILQLLNHFPNSCHSLRATIHCPVYCVSESWEVQLCKRRVVASGFPSLPPSHSWYVPSKYI